MILLNHLLAVALGGAIGATLRYAVGLLTSAWFGSGFPVATLFVNVLGSLVMGYVAIRFVSANEATKLFMMTGILGGFTTFSAFSLDLFKLLQSNQDVGALIYTIATFGLTISALFLGARLAS